MDQQANNPGMRFHAAGLLRGLGSVVQSPLFEGRFGRMFRNLPAFEPADGKLEALANTMFEPEDTGNDDEESEFDNPNIVAGITYLGQFIDHDITFDPASKLQRQNDPDALHNFRTPRFDLDSVYGRGPDDEPFLYKPDGIKFRIGENGAGQEDLPRTAPEGDGTPRRALIGDPRNDENLIVSQLHLAFLKYHNKVVDDLQAKGLPEGQLFE
ncbi:MAG TPA: peroxidase family protein, partial [Rubrobacter sp.]